MNLLQLDMQRGEQESKKRLWKHTWVTSVGILMLAILVNACGGPQEVADKPLKTDTDSLSYAIGMNIGYNYRVQGIELDPEILAAGFRAIQDSTDTKFTRAQMGQVIQGYAQRNQQVIQSNINLNRQLAAARNKVRSQKYMEANATREGVISLPSGIQYEVLKSGEGRTPTPEDRVFLHFTGSDMDGNVYADTYRAGEPAEATVADLLPGQV
ncbi:MAG: FKBP-type peptidyl-prolyl cis-trans isomerase N-terminal domain-containing protein, partial [Bacteroidota bacterium]